MMIPCIDLVGEKGGCMIVDSTRKGKRFPDSMSKTIPIWTCVLNRSVANFRSKACNNSDEVVIGEGDWDCSLHLPLWVSDLEKAAIDERVDGWVKELEASGADIAALSSCLKKPLRPLWISQKTVIWLNEVPDHDSWDFTPVILVSASSQSGAPQIRSNSEFSWNYIPGAGDDEESWARGLSPALFWKHVYDLINSGPDLCNQKVADIVEKDRVFRTHRGQIAPQVLVKPPPFMPNVEPVLCANQEVNLSSDDGCIMYWVGSTNIAVGAAHQAGKVTDVDCILNCDRESISVDLLDTEGYLHLPMVNSKLDRFSLLRNLPSAVNFAKCNLSRRKKLLVCCHSGEDISVCVCLAILASLFTEEGVFDNEKCFTDICITKMDMRKRLVYICKYATTARPSRGNLKQVFSFLGGGRV